MSPQDCQLIRKSGSVAYPWVVRRALRKQQVSFQLLQLLLHLQQ